MLVRLVLSSILLISTSLFAEEFFPESIYQLDGKYTHHVIVVEKSTHTLYLYKNEQNLPKLVKSFKIATGERTGNKRAQGDKKTPEGIYFFKRFRPASELVSAYGKVGLIYGAGAFTLNYPNLIDKKNGKTGSGIWLHSTDDDARISKGLDSKGCVVASDADIKEISKYIELGNTPIIVTQNISFLKKGTWDANKAEITETIVEWAKAWKNNDFDTYIDQYSISDFRSDSKGNFYSYKNYKRRVFKRPGKPEINFRNISILNFKDYAVVTMLQDYKSKTINDIGKKTLFLKRNAEYDWKIISEDWESTEESDQAFVPMSKYFKVEVSDDSGSI
jgi:murein L,D-transpeptidase YafK